MSLIHAITMPKWGLSMTEGKVNGWLKELGQPVARGEEIVEAESDKIAGAVEARADGVLRRRIAAAGDVIAVGGLLGVVADADAAEADIDAMVARFQAEFVPPSLDAGETGPQPQKAVVAGRKLRYLRRGEGGEAVILIHGFGGELNNWLFNHEPLAAARSVFALDLPGHGESTKDVGDGSLDTLAQAVIGFMDAVGIDRARLVGHSLGGAVAMACALAAPPRVSALALVASAGLGPEIDGDYIAGFVAAATRNQLKPQAAKLFADPTLVTRQLVDELLRFKRIEGVDACLRTLAAALFPDGRQAVVLRRRLAELAIPVLAIWGGRDAIIPAAHGAGLPGSGQLALIAQAGHMVQMEAAARVNQLLEDFLR